MRLIKITIPKESQEDANLFATTLDPNGMDTFKLDEELGTSSIAIQDDSSDYSEGMKEHFEYEIIEI